MEQWKVIPEFPRYSVSNEGRIRNDGTGRIMKCSLNQQRVLNVGLMGGAQKHRSVPLLVATAFLPRVEAHFVSFDTPICLDANPWNCHVNNLMWRPWWFAVRYKRQWADQDIGILINKQLRNLSTDEVFADSRSCAMWYGLLEWDLFQSIQHRTYVWPLYQQFEILR